MRLPAAHLREYIRNKGYVEENASLKLLKLWETSIAKNDKFIDSRGLDPFLSFFSLPEFPISHERRLGRLAAYYRAYYLCEPVVRKICCWSYWRRLLGDCTYFSRETSAFTFTNQVPHYQKLITATVVHNGWISFYRSWYGQNFLKNLDTGVRAH